MDRIRPKHLLGLSITSFLVGLGALFLYKPKTH